MHKIALIDPVGGHGGMDFYDYGLAQGLGAHQVKVWYCSSSQTNVRTYPNVKTVLCFKKVWDTSNKWLRLFFFLKGYFKAFQVAKKAGVETVHLQFFDLGWLNVLVMLVLSRFKFQKVLTLHDVSSFKGKNVGFSENFILKRFDKFVVHNRLSYAELLDKLPKKNPIAIIPHGNYLPFVQELAYEVHTDRPLKLLFFGQIKKVKGLDVLLEALGLAIQENLDIRLVIAGKPWHDELSYYKELIAALDLTEVVTTHFEYIPNEAVASYFEACDVVILPYRKIYQSGVLLLAMSYGRVTVCSDLPAFKEVVDDGVNGYLFEQQNAQDLAGVLLKMAQHKAQLLQVREQASRKLKNEFDWSEIGAKTKAFYNV